MDRFSFWQRWLLVVSWVVVAFGLLLALFNQTPVFDFLFNKQINPVFWGAAPLAVQTITFQRWIYGVLGATVAGWGLTMSFIAHYPFGSKERWAWNCLATGMLVWFITDTSLSLYFKVVFNALFNVLLLVAVFLPLIFTKRHFNSVHREGKGV